LAPHSRSVAIGLGTGNIEPAAYLKLRRVGLDGYFRFGGFGSDHRLRSEILRTAATRGSQQLGRQLSECDTIVIGDTFHDVDAALEIGARAVCVGTSGIALDQLLARGARHVFETLADPRVLQVLLH
jgi:phosphoglycolate phosphatase-like HAD superfamily hydrolase